MDGHIDEQVPMCKKMQQYCIDYKGPRNTCGCPIRSLPPIITELPFQPNESNIKEMEKWIFDQFISSSFNICEQQKLPMMDSAPPVKLLIEDNSTPVAVTKATPIPINWLPTIKAELNKDVRLGVIEPVLENTPVTWCSRMGIVPKKSGDPRRVIDFRPLNKVTKKQSHVVESPFVQASKIPANTWKSCFDAWNGYHSVPFDDESNPKFTKGESTA